MEIGRRANPPNNLLLLLRGDPLFIDVTLKAFVDRGEPTMNKLLLHVVQDHVVAGARRDLRNTIAHRPRTNHSNHLSHSSLLLTGLTRFTRLLKTGRTAHLCPTPSC